MKKSYLKLALIGCVLLFNACKPHLTDVLKDSAAAQIKEKLTDPNSYSAVTWGKLDTLYRPIGGYKQYNRISFVIDSLQKATYSETASSAPAGEKATLNRYEHEANTIKEIKRLIDERSELVKTMPREPVGWVVKHTFKTTGKMGTIEFLDYLVYINQDLSRVDSLRNETELNRFLKDLKEK
jgi:hypothetical protein